jgi:hypothetical protein
MRARLGCGLLLFVILLLPAQSAGRNGSGGFDRLLPEIRRHAPGSLYDVQGPYPGPDGRARYRIKWMTTQGRIVWFEVDARNGHILGMVTGTMPSNRGPTYASPYGSPYRDSSGIVPPPAYPYAPNPDYDGPSGRSGDDAAPRAYRPGGGASSPGDGERRGGRNRNGHPPR